MSKKSNDQYLFERLKREIEEQREICHKLGLDFEELKEVLQVIQNKVEYVEGKADSIDASQFYDAVIKIVHILKNLRTWDKNNAAYQAQQRELFKSLQKLEATIERKEGELSLTTLRFNEELSRQKDLNLKMENLDKRLSRSIFIYIPRIKVIWANHIKFPVYIIILMFTIAFLDSSIDNFKKYQETREQLENLAKLFQSYEPESFEKIIPLMKNDSLFQIEKVKMDSLEILNLLTIP
ncbi:hypothetical protein [Ekhidna sp.]|jgi:regulator of replication initiation timing|uniref:hypothetical protein n=1 Tax=Ekhidna sp. TaxID=2608089 RepID=UPI0032ECBAAA